jgi:uncharacterized repeat protein (TIGR01451 family)
MNGQEIFRSSYLRAILGSAVLALVAPAAAQAATVDIDSFDLPPGKSVTIEFQVTVDSPMPPGDSQVCNQGTLTATNPVAGVLTDDPDVVGGTDPTCTTIQLLADLSVTKTDGATDEVPGTSVVYTIVASNAGPATVVDGVVADTFPGSLTGCNTTSVAAGGASGNDSPIVGNINDTGLTIPSGGTVTYTVTCSIAPAATGTLTNTATISSAATTDPAPADNSASDSDTLVPSTDVAITKTDGATTEIPGTSVTYTIVASNSGPSTAASVTVADTFPGILSGCSTSSVAAGGATGHDAGPTAGSFSDSGITLPPSATVTYTATCTIAATATGTLDNTATISSATTDPNGGNNGATDSDTLDPQANLAITKTDGSATEVPGTPVTYTITVTNAAGPSVATGVTVADTFAGTLSGCSTTSVAAGGATGSDAGPTAGDVNDTGITLPVGATVTYTATCNIDGAATGTLANTATVATAITDPTPANNSATDTDTLDPSADVAITKTDSAASAIPGTPVSYTIVASNSGPSTATGVTVADSFPGILASCSTTSVAAGGATGNDVGPTAGNLSDGGIALPSGASVTYTATCNIDPVATGSLVNTATVTATTTDPNAGNNSATDTDPLNPSADVAVSKDDGVTSVIPGGSTTYTMVLSNSGPSTSTPVTFADTFPAVLTCTTTSVVAGLATGNDAGPIGGNINDAGITLPPGSSVTYTAVCTVSVAATGTMANTATATVTTSDPTPGNNSATDTDDVTPLDLGDAPDSSVGGGFFYPTRVVDNGARHVATGITLGATRDFEANGQPTAAADGDDVNGTGDDEDGITFTAPLIACQSAPITVNASGAGVLQAWVDWNRDGDWADLGEQVAADMAVIGGNNNLPLTVPCDASAGASHARFRLATASGLGTTGLTADGEVEDYQVTLIGLDFGDAPDTSVGAGFLYPTRLVDNGPRHAAQGPVLLGALRDSEANGQPGALATGDDLATSDDEDGVTFGTLLRGQNATITVTTSVADTLLQGWIDWNADGDWADPGEQVFTNQVIAAAGANPIIVAVPAGVAPDAVSFARFRLTANVPADLNLPATGYTDGGEVEDYRIQFASIANLSITKTNGATSEVPGTPVVYTIVASNAGPSAAGGVSVADTFAAPLSGCGWSSLSAGGASGNTNNAGPANLGDTLSMPAGSSVTYTVTCTIDPAAAGTVANTATIGSAVFDENAADNTATDSDPLTPQVDLTITKTDGATTEIPGTAVVYTIVASNAGPSTDPSVTVADSFPGILTGCSTTSVAVGATGNDLGPTPGNFSDSGINMPPGSSVTYTATCSIPSSATGSLANTATVTASVTDTAPASNTATDTDTLVPEADLAVSKDDGSPTEIPGTTVQYTVVASNPGPSDNPNVNVADTFAAPLSGCSWTTVAAGGATGNDNGSGAALADNINLPAGGSVTYTVTCSIGAAATGSLVNTATIATGGAVTDPAAGDNSATDTDTLVPTADLSITKSDGSATEVPGTTVIYTLVVANAGPSNETNATVADTFPGTLSGCSTTSLGAGGALGNDPGPSAGNVNDGGVALPVGASVTYTATCTISPAATGSLSNTATITASAVDPTGGNNTATDTDTLTPQADLEITKVVDDPSVMVGQAIVYTLTVVNHGPSDATAVVISDPLPGAITFVSSAGCVESPVGGVPTCTVGNLAAGATAPAVTINATVNANGTSVNTASVASAETDPVPGNNSDSATVATDLIPPIVTGVDSVANTGDGSLDACETARFPINQLKITFGEALENLSGVAPNDAGNPANYRLVRAGSDQTFQTNVCGPVLGDDVAVSIDSVLYQVDTPSAPLSRSTLTVNGGTYLRNGLYRLFACSTLRDLATNPLDGDGDLTGGDDFVRLFRVDTDNMFVNGYLDCAEAGWDETPPSSPEMVWDPATDADASPHSGSFGVGTSGTASLGVSQCVTFGALGSFEAPPYHLEGKVRFDGDPGERVTVRLSCQSFSGAACGGSSLGTSQSSVLVDALPFTRFAFDPVVPPAALSARCGITLQNAVPPNAYGAYLDQMLLLGTGGLPFADGFESGTVGAWSGHTP